MVEITMDAGLKNLHCGIAAAGTAIPRNAGGYKERKERGARKDGDGSGFREDKRI